MASHYGKIVVSQNIIEVWEYEKLNPFGGNNIDGKTTDGKDKEKNYLLRQRKRKNRIRQLICTNFDSGSKFVTLTFDDSKCGFQTSDVKACNRFFKRFILRLKYRYPELKYVAVIEFQRRGAVHYHMVCNLPFIKKSELASIWAGGFIQINRIDHVDNVGAYVIKYMCKDTEDKRLQGENAYLHSKYLDEPTTLCSWSSSDDWLALHDSLQEKSPVYARTYTSEEGGEVIYKQYNLNKSQQKPPVDSK